MDSGSSCSVHKSFRNGYAKEQQAVEEITSDRLVDILLAEGLRKGIMEYQPAKDAVIALIPETKDISDSPRSILPVLHPT
jgi:hypothetical protein